MAKLEIPAALPAMPSWAEPAQRKTKTVDASKSAVATTQNIELTRLQTQFVAAGFRSKVAELQSRISELSSQISQSARVTGQKEAVKAVLGSPAMLSEIAAATEAGKQFKSLGVQVQDRIAKQHPELARAAIIERYAPGATTAADPDELISRLPPATLEALGHEIEAAPLKLNSLVEQEPEIAKAREDFITRFAGSSEAIRALAPSVADAVRPLATHQTRLTALAQKANEAPGALLNQSERDLAHVYEDAGLAPRGQAGLEISMPLQQNHDHQRRRFGHFSPLQAQ